MAFEKTIKALRWFDVDAPRRQAMWDSAESDADVKRAQDEDEAAAKPVREAFYQDTSHLNSRSHCMDLTVAAIASLVRALPNQGVKTSQEA